jgi:hypothetical protein
MIPTAPEPGVERKPFLVEKQSTIWRFAMRRMCNIAHFAQLQTTAG